VTIWSGRLDMLLVNQLDANFYAVHPDGMQKSNHPTNRQRDGVRRAGLLRPVAKPEQAVFAAS